MIGRRRRSCRRRRRLGAEVVLVCLHARGAKSAEESSRRGDRYEVRVMPGNEAIDVVGDVVAAAAGAHQPSKSLLLYLVRSVVGPVGARNVADWGGAVFECGRKFWIAEITATNAVAM